MENHEESRSAKTAPDAGNTAPGDNCPDDEQKAAALAEAGSSRRERLAGSAVGFGGGGPNNAGVYTSADSEGMGVDELLNDGQEEGFSRTEDESGRIEHRVGEEPATGTVPRK